MLESQKNMMTKALVRMISISSVESINQLCNYNTVYKHLEHFHIKILYIMHRQLYNWLYITVVKTAEQVNLVIIYYCCCRSSITFII